MTMIEIHTCKVPLNPILGSEQSLELLARLKDAPNETLYTPATKYIDYLWDKEYAKVFLFNSLYIVYFFLVAFFHLFTGSGTKATKGTKSVRKATGAGDRKGGYPILIYCCFLLCIEVYQALL